MKTFIYRFGERLLLCAAVMILALSGSQAAAQTLEDCNFNDIPDIEEKDSDQDGFIDDCDNCVAVSNVTQFDSDRDGIGNACDPDLNNDAVVGLPDFNDFRASFGSKPGDDNYNPDADFDDSEGIGIGDFNIFRSFFGKAPGPGLPPLPDLVIITASVEPLTGVPGETLTVMAFLGNGGVRPASDVEVEACSGNWCANTMVDKVSPMDMVKVNLVLDVSEDHTKENPHFFEVTADPNQKIREWYTDNNHFQPPKPTFVVVPELPQPTEEDDHDDEILLKDGVAMDARTTTYPNGSPGSFTEEIKDPDKFIVPEDDDGGPEQPRVDPRVREADAKAQPGEMLRYLVKFNHDVPGALLPELDDRFPMDRFSDFNIRNLEKRIAGFEGLRRARMGSEAGEALMSMTKQLGGRMVEFFTLAGTMLVEVPKGALERFEEMDVVQHIEPEIDGSKPPDANPNNDVDDGRDRIVSDPYFNGGATGVPFTALLDSGVRTSHTLFTGPDHIWFVEDCVNGNSACNDTGDPDYDGQDDCWNHGTSTAAIITGNSDLGNAYRGVTAGWLDSWKVYPENCGGLSTTAVLRGYDQAVYWGDKVIVAEMQSGQGPTGSIASAADDAYDAGSLTIAANGNNGCASGCSGTVNSPANAHKAIGIGNYDVQSGNQINSQSRGPTSDNRYKPDIQAPTNTETASSSGNTALKTFGGTSGATPYGAGAASVFTDWFNLTGLTSSNNGKIYAGLINAGPRGWASFNNTTGTGQFDLPTNGVVYFGSRNVGHHDNDFVNFTVPAGSDEVRVALWWPEGTFDHNDVDVYLRRPDGAEVQSSISSVSVFEHIVRNNPTPSGTWRLRLYGYDVRFFGFPVNQKVYYSIFVRN
jgi:hypothetical protein